MPPDRVRLADTRAWLAKAADDLRGAELDLSAERPLLGDALFHCQQAAEKALKAFLTWHDRPFRKTHNLVELGDQCREIDPTLENLLRRAARLTEFAWKFRYPGEPFEPSPDEAQDGLRLAQDVLAAVVDRLPSGTWPA